MDDLDMETATSTSGDVTDISDDVMDDVTDGHTDTVQSPGSVSMDSTSTMSDSIVTSMTPSKKDKICLVCGDRALGYNFNAISCESCKAFFRRNAHKTIRGRCEGKCDITIESRSFCKRCRQAKCFSVGMRKDMILNDDQKKVRKQKIIFNKLRRQGHILPEDQFVFDEIISQAKEETDSSNSNSLPQTVCIKQEKSDSQCAFTREKPDSQKFVPWSESQEAVRTAVASLSDHHRQLLNELIAAHEASAFLSCTTTMLDKLPTNPTEFANIAEGFVRRIIKVTKHIVNFKKLCKDDQICLLKGAVVDVMMLRSAVNYDPATESWSLSTMSCLQDKGGNQSLMEKITAFKKMSKIPDGSGEQSLLDKITAFKRGMSMPSGNSLPAGLSLPSGMTSTPSGMTSPPIGMTSLPDSMSPHNGMAFPNGMSSMTSDTMSSGMSSPPEASSTSNDPGRISADILKFGGRETMEMFKSYSKFIKSLMSTIRGDLLMLKILIVMAIFSTDRGDLVDSSYVQKIQEEYAEILQKYIQSRFPEEKTLFAQVVMKLTDLRNINDVHTKMLLKMKVEDVEPLLIEIFDLPCP